MGDHKFSWSAYPHPIPQRETYLILGKLLWRDQKGFTRDVAALREVSKLDFEQCRYPAILILDNCKRLEVTLCRARNEIEGVT